MCYKAKNEHQLKNSDKTMAWSNAEVNQRNRKNEFQTIKSRKDNKANLK